MTFDDIDGHQAIDFMRSVFRFVDDQIVALEKIIQEDMDREGDSGLLGYAEYFAGMGFVAGQRYITSVRGLFKIGKQQALAFGPEFSSGVSYAQLINAAANYWKHSDEWDFEKLNDQQLATRAIIEKAGVSVGPTELVAYNVFNVLEIAGFMEVIPLLSKWSNAPSASVG
jgi:hypothetical protein